jgi:hypothetical protein
VQEDLQKLEKVVFDPVGTVREDDLMIRATIGLAADRQFTRHATIRLSLMQATRWRKSVDSAYR